MHWGKGENWAVGAIMDWIDGQIRSSKDCWYLRSTSFCVCVRGNPATRSLCEDTRERLNDSSDIHPMKQSLLVSTVSAALLG